MDKRTVLAGLLAAVVVACGGPARDMLGGAMRDAGEAMEVAGNDARGSGVGMLDELAKDAGRALRDAGEALDGGIGRDGAASAQRATTIIGVCESQLGYRGKLGAEDGSALIRYYSEVDIGGLAAEELVGAAFVMCDWESMGAENVGCDGPVTNCEKIGTYQRRFPDCVVQPFIETRPGTAIVQCGEVREETASSITTTVGGHWKSVKLVLPSSS